MSGTKLCRVSSGLGLSFLAVIVLGGPSLVADDEPSPEREAKVAAQCGEAAALLRAGKTKEARDLMTPLVKDPRLARSRSHGLALYYHGFASFLLQDYLAAGRSLGQLAPFAEQAFGSHARYLLARVYHREDERAEAAVQYERVLADYDSMRKNATEALEKPEKLNPEQKAKLEALANVPPPEHVARAGFYLGLLHYEGGRFPDAQVRLADFLARNPKSPFVADAQFYQGCCAVHLRQFPEAIQTLQALADKESALAGPAFLWLAKALVASADPDDEEGYQPALKRAIAALRQAVEKSTKDRRGAALLELADVYQMANQPDEAAAIYGRMFDEHSMPRRDEELLQHRVTALHLAGRYDESDKLAVQFEKRYPKGLLLPEVLFRRAESAAARPGGAGLAEAAQLYRLVADKYPEFVHAQRARLGLARMHYRKGEFEVARGLLEKIPQPERSGDLAIVPYLLADCLIRLAPAKADDALASGRLQEALGTAATLSGDFTSTNPDSPLAADALLRLGLCQQRLAAVMAQEEERKKLFEAARSSYERALVEYPLHEVGPTAAFARARCIAMAGDANEAIKRLQAFATGALKKEPVAPLALLHLAELIGAQENKAADAVRILTVCRQRHESALVADPVRAAWAPLIQYRHGITLMEASQFDEARTVFDHLRRLERGSVVAVEAVLCWGEALRDGGYQRIEKANQVLATPNLPPAEIERAKRDVETGQRMVRDAARYFQAQADEWKSNDGGGDIRARLLYEAIWMERTAANEEQAAARDKIREERRAQREREIAEQTPEGQQPPAVAPFDVPPADVPIQPAEKKARALYQALLDGFSDLPLANAARLELGEMHAERGEHELAIKLLAEALDKEPPADLSDKLRLRLATCHAARGDLKSALAQLDMVARAPENPLAGQAQWRAGECQIRQENLEGAIQRLALFRDQEAFQNMGGVSDGALIRLGQVLARLKKWEQSRNAHAQVLSRFPDSPWAPEARLGLGWGWQRQKDYAKALEAYAQVPLDQPTEMAARARVLIGVCKVALGQYAEAMDVLLAVPANYDAPELSAFALVEAAHTASQLNQPGEAEKLLRRVVRGYPKSPWAEIAQERLRTPSETPPHDVQSAATLLAPETKQLPPLEMLGHQQAVRSALDDAVEIAYQAAILSRKPPERPGPVPFTRLTLPEPFEHQQLIPLRIEQAAERLPEN
jgi:TolA-binding protein